MKNITLGCNICDVDENTLDCKLHGIRFIPGHERDLEFTEDADIHICAICLSAIEKLRTNKR